MTKKTKKTKGGSSVEGGDEPRAAVFAAGDCAQYGGINYALWSEAMEQGRVAGANAAGDIIHYNFATPGLTFNGMNTSLFAIGDQGQAGQHADHQRQGQGRQPGPR